MKVIHKNDLMLLIPLVNDREVFDIDDFNLILERFGDDYFVVDGQFQRTKSNKEMYKIREMVDG